MTLQNKKIILIFLVIFSVFIFMISRMFILSVLQYDFLNREKSLTNKFNKIRIDIVDRNGIIIASDIKTKTLYLNKYLLNNENKKFVADSLAKLLDLDRNNLYKRLNDENTKSKYLLVKKHILPEKEKKIKALPIASLVFEDDLLRYYPHGNLFSHILGYVDASKNGVIGIENYYNDYLLNSSNEKLRLTLDIRIQNALRETILESYEIYRPNFTVGIVSEIKTGNILAIVSFPDFDLNKTNDRNNTFNHATYGNYELGSVFKIFTFANGLETKVINENTVFDVSHDVDYGIFIAKDIESIKRRQTLTVDKAFALSSNIATVQIAKMIGIDRQLKFFENLGLLEKLQIDINEVSLPLQPRKWKDINLMTIAYGYGVAVSPLHILNATNAILNDGNMITPRFCYNFDNKTKFQVVSKKTSDTIKNFFELTVKNGTARLANVNGYNIGGKTGTARKIVGRDYKKGEHIVSFVGAFPINNPQYSIIIVSDRPKGISEKTGDGTGSTVATKIAKDIILKITPFLELY